MWGPGLNIGASSKRAYLPLRRLLQDHANANIDEVKSFCRSVGARRHASSLRCNRMIRKDVGQADRQESTGHKHIIQVLYEF
ncbi:hypothetical protein TH5_17820 [Thalassospira xianhensis MCCC 1A02616]|uniref:Uncharacterized protein n=1 Tax=Thalassospira xianhensis MCCC 1A02616 TaxID=1177929 RepID=A0A367U8X3_9PROT|nr:hypothetical protein TH5_17820 [Thalassospira xianhensis MCCC 1A02616]